MFQLTAEEHSALMLKNATSKPGRGGRRKLPLAFTESGAIMAATILNSDRDRLSPLTSPKLPTHHAPLPRPGVQLKRSATQPAA